MNAAGAPPVIILSRSDIAALMTPRDYLGAVEDGFLVLERGDANVPAPWHLDVPAGAFHGKGASLERDRHYVALKLNGNFPSNSQHGLPTVQGAILLLDGETGSPLAIMDSIEVTLRRTAAATALAARYLARADSRTVLVCGCGDQAPGQLDALAMVLPIRHVLAFDRDPARAAQLTSRHVEVTAVDDLETAAAQSDVIITCTTARQPFLYAGMVRPGTFVAAVGADHPTKSEIDPALMQRVLVVTDSTEQCALMGDLHHAVAAGAMTEDQVHCELADLVAETKQGRTRDDEITLFDSTGIAVQDAASAVAIHSRARSRGVGLTLRLGS